MTRNIKTVFLWDKQLLQTVSLKEPAEYLTAYEGSLSSNSSLMITNVFMVSVTNMLSETWWISSLWISHIHSNRSLFLPVQACGWVSPCTPQPIDTSFGGTCSLVMRPPSLHGCTPCGTLLKSPHTSDRDRDVPSRRCSEDQKLYLMPAWLIFAVKPFLDFQWYLLSFFHPACVCSGLSYVHTHMSCHDMSGRMQAIHTCDQEGKAKCWWIGPLHSISAISYLLLPLSTNDSTVKCGCHGTRGGNSLSLMYKLRYVHFKTLLLIYGISTG